VPCDEPLKIESSIMTEAAVAEQVSQRSFFNWASSHDSDFNFDFGVSASESPREVSSLLVANEVAAFPLASDQRFRDNLPPIVAQNASAFGTDISGYFSEGHAVSVFARDGDSIYYCYSSYTRGTEFLMSY
jgi:predicted dithiol-disulfide oxidoreductase (DUF899 family)